MELQESMESMKRTESAPSVVVKDEETDAPVSEEKASTSIKEDEKPQEQAANEESDSTDSDDDDEDDEDEGDAKGKEDASGTFQIPQRFTKSGRKRSVPFPVRVSVTTLTLCFLLSCCVYEAPFIL